MAKHLRILIVSEDVPNPNLGGLGKHALNLAQELAGRGHQVDFLGNSKFQLETCPEQAGPGKFFGEITGHERGWKERHIGAYTPWALSLNSHAVLAPILRHAKNYDIVHYHGHFPWIAADIPSDIAFLQTRHDQGGDCMLKTRFRSDNTVCRQTSSVACATCATANPNALQRGLSSFTVKRMRRGTELAYAKHPVIFVSAFLKANFERIARKAVQGVVVHNAVDCKKLDAASAVEKGSYAEAHNFTNLLAKDGLHLFTAGSMFAYKGFGPLLAALTAEAKACKSGFHLTVAGAGPEEKALRQLYESEHISFLGWTAYPEVIRQVHGADAVLVPSVWEEPCATSILEALALGKTVFALRGGGTPEMLSYADTAGGRLVLADSMDDLARAALSHVPNPVVPGQSSASFLNNFSTMTDAVELLYFDKISALTH